MHDDVVGEEAECVAVEGMGKVELGRGGEERWCLPVEGWAAADGGRGQSGGESGGGNDRVRVARSEKAEAAQ